MGWPADGKQPDQGQDRGGAGVARQNWDDLRYILAVAETGSVSAAARRLGVNHATVLRRIAAFEDESGAELFDKTRRGYTVAPDRARVIEAAREVEAAVESLDRMVAGLQAPLSGKIRVTSTDSLSLFVLPGAIGRVCASAPGLDVSVIASNDRTDMARVQAEIAVRPSMKLPDDLVGVAVAGLRFAPYARRLPAGGVDPGMSHSGRDRWLVLTGILERAAPGVWLGARRDAGQCKMSGMGADSFLVLAAMAVAGAGIALLPCIVGDADPSLERLFDPDPPIEVPVWVATHADLAEVPRIARFRASLAAEIAAEADRMAGRTR